MMTTTPAATALGVAQLERPVAFMFPGLGDHSLNMGRDLYRFVPVFREQMDLCTELIKPELGLDPRCVIHRKAWRSWGCRGSKPRRP